MSSLTLGSLNRKAAPDSHQPTRKTPDSIKSKSQLELATSASPRGVDCVAANLPSDLSGQEEEMSAPGDLAQTLGGS